MLKNSTKIGAKGHHPGFELKAWSISFLRNPEPPPRSAKEEPRTRIPVYDLRALQIHTDRWDGMSGRDKSTNARCPELARVFRGGGCVCNFSKFALAAAMTYKLGWKWDYG
eukprot:303327-Rhodomonas_salina.2